MTLNEDDTPRYGPIEYITPSVTNWLINVMYEWCPPPRQLIWWGDNTKPMDVLAERGYEVSVILPCVVEDGTVWVIDYAASPERQESILGCGRVAAGHIPKHIFITGATPMSRHLDSVLRSKLGAAHSHLYLSLHAMGFIYLRKELS